MTYHYKYSAGSKHFHINVVDPGTDQIIFQAQYPSFTENALTGELQEDATLIEVGAMKSFDDVQGLQSFLLKNKLIQQGDTIVLVGTFADGGSVQERDIYAYMNEMSRKWGMTEGTSAFIKNYLVRHDNKGDVDAIMMLADKIAAVDNKHRSLEHIAEAIQYQFTDEPLFGRIGIGDLESLFRYGRFVNDGLDRMNEIGILPVDGKVDIQKADELERVWKKLGLDDDAAARNLIYQYYAKVLVPEAEDKEQNRGRDAINALISVCRKMEGFMKNKDVKLSGAAASAISEMINPDQEHVQDGDYTSIRTNEITSGYTKTETINKAYRELKEKMGEKKAKKYFEQVDKLMPPLRNEIVDYRTNGIVVKGADGRYIFHALIDTSLKKWRLGFTQDVTDQFTGSSTPDIASNEITQLSKKEPEKPKRTERAISQDKRYKAQHPGKRTSDDGSVYYEYRDNRSDEDRRKKFKSGGKIRHDKAGNYIGDGSYHVDATVYDFKEYPQIKSSITKSATTETVYVYYYNTDNGKEVVVRFSNHENNAVKFGDQLNGRTASKNEILYHLGLKERVFIPATRLFIDTKQIAKKDIGKYEIADKSIKEMYAMGVNADLSKYKGKIAKDGNRLILSDKVEEIEEKRIGALGNPVVVGKYIYKDKDEFARGGRLKRADKDYKFFVLNENKKVIAGFEYREDAVDFTKEVDAAAGMKIYSATWIKNYLKFDPYDYENWENLFV